MRIYYVMETRGHRCHVLSALGVDPRAWNRLHRRVLRWRQELEHYYGISADGELRPCDLICGVPQNKPVCHRGCRRHPASLLGAQAAAEGLHVVEDFAVETGGVQVINVCLKIDETPAHRRVALDRLFNRINATASHEGGYALLVFGQEPDETVSSTYGRLRGYNPVPVRVGACGDGWHTRNLPIDRIIGGPLFRDPGADCLLQVAGLVAHALLWREEPSASGADSGESAGIFTVLDRALNRRASRNDPHGVVRR